MNNRLRKYALAFLIVILLFCVACSKEEEPKNTIGNGGNSIDLDSMNAPGGDVQEEIPKQEEVNLTVGVEKEPINVTLRIDWDILYLDNIEYTNIEDLRDAIIASGCDTIVFDHADATKKVYDEVSKVLSDIEEVTEISVIEK